jgi:NADH-quinone oxidoreductase subunit M
VTADPIALRLFLSGLVVLLVLAPDLLLRGRLSASTVLNAALPALALLMPDGALAYGLLALATVAQAYQARPAGLQAAGMLLVAAVALGVGTWALLPGRSPALAFHMSMLALVLRAGLVGLHTGMSALWRKLPALQVQQYTTLLALVISHLRFSDPAAAQSAADIIVILGASSSLAFGLTSLVQRDLDGLLRASMLMHGGLMIAATGAAGKGHAVAALFVSLSMTLAVVGLCLMALALEARVGKVLLQRPGGRARSFPRLAAAFGFFGAAGVGMPGTAGFIADDLILHALWSESVYATIAVALASALLAVATLRAITLCFMGPQVVSVAPDLMPAERWFAFALILLLLFSGLTPQLVVGASAGLFGSH